MAALTWRTADRLACDTLQPAILLSLPDRFRSAAVVTTEPHDAASVSNDRVLSSRLRNAHSRRARDRANSCPAEHPADAPRAHRRGLRACREVHGIQHDAARPALGRAAD